MSGGCSLDTLFVGRPDKIGLRLADLYLDESVMASAYVRT